MRYFYKIFLVVCCVSVFSAYAGNSKNNNTTTQKQDSVTTTINAETKKQPINTPTTSKGITPTKTNWSKIKDLFI